MQRSYGGWTIVTEKEDLLTVSTEDFFIDLVSIRKNKNGNYHLYITFDENHLSISDEDARTHGFFPDFINKFYARVGNREKKLFRMDFHLNTLSSKNQSFAIVKNLFDTLDEFTHLGHIRENVFSFIELEKKITIADDKNALFTKTGNIHEFMRLTSSNHSMKLSR